MISTEYPIWLVFACLATGLGYAFLLYRKTNKEVSALIRYSLFTLRFTVVFLLCFFLLNPLIRHNKTYTEKPVIIMAADNSASILKNKDSAFYRKDFPAQLQNFCEELRDKYDVRFITFSNETKNDSSLRYTGKETNISAVFTEVQNSYEGKNLGALILASDGIYNTGANPLYRADKSAYPVFTVALGDTALQKDAFIQKINHNNTAYIGNQFPVEIQLQAFDLQGKEAMISVMQGGQKIAEQPVKYASDRYTHISNFLLDASKPGMQHYEVVLSLNEGEKAKSNNRMPFVVDVIDKREKIAIIATAPHPDIAALKEAIEANQSYETEVFLADNFNASLKPYSLAIIHQVGANTPTAKRIQNEVSQHKTPIWQFSKNDFWATPAVRFGSSVNRYNDAEPILNKSFALFNSSEELKTSMKDWPAVNCALADYKISNGASVLINQQIGQVQTNNPIFVLADESGQKSALFCGDGLWRWKFRDYADHGDNKLFNELVQKTVQYLSVKADKSFFKVFAQKLSNENEPVSFEAEVYNPSYELVNEPEVGLVISDSTGKKFTYTFSKTNKAYYLNVGNFPPGKYNYQAQVKINDQLNTQAGSFTIKPLLVENASTVADHALLYNISKKTGGQLFYPRQLQELAKKLNENENIKTLVHEQKEVDDFINLRWLFALVLLLVSVEWFLRKYNGLL